MANKALKISLVIALIIAMLTGTIIYLNKQNDNIVDANNNEVSGDIIGNENNELETEKEQEEIENMEKPGEIVDENKISNVELTDVQLIEKYKLSDKYTIELSKDNDSNFYNVLEFKNLYGEMVASDVEFISDGVSHKIECESKGKKENNDHTFDTYEIKLNGNLLKIDNDVVGDTGDEKIGVIDLDESDKYKEIVILKVYGIFAETAVYRVTKNGLESINVPYYEPMLKINSKYIIPKYNYQIEETLIEGYYLYEEGEFKFIDRFLTGEKIKDEEGIYPKNFQNQIFTSFYPDNSLFFAPYNNNLVSIKGQKIKIFSKKENFGDKYNKEITDVYYNCELVEDAYVTIWSENGREEIFLPKGTKLVD